MNDLLETLNKASQVLKQAHEKPLTTGNYICFMNKLTFFATQNKKFFLIGTRIITNPAFLNHKWDKMKDNFIDLFQETDIDEAPAFATRNAAIRARSLVRKGISLSKAHHKSEFNLNGFLCVRKEKVDSFIIGEENKNDNN
jgi:hypothetical protein